jgi:hypothetical protein
MIQQYNLLVALIYNGTPHPCVGEMRISREDPSTITTEFSKRHWATLLSVSASSYEEAENMFLTYIHNYDYMKWARTYFPNKPKK